MPQIKWMNIAMFLPIDTGKYPSRFIDSSWAMLKGYLIVSGQKGYWKAVGKCPNYTDTHRVNGPIGLV
jgi:hypothetical protein